MEVLTGDRKIPNPEDEDEEEEEFPTHISPFSETADITLPLLLANPTAAMLQSTTPQKLRIRCNGRSPSVEAAATLADPGQLGSGATGDNGLSPDNDDEHLKAQGGEFIKWKRKRKRTSSSTRRRSKRVERLELFLESLVNKMMEKQEQMHKELIEMVQEREKDRIAKEEAWKQHELERITRDEEIRAQETSRSLALIHFVQNLLGTEVQVPPLAPLVAQPVATLPPISNHNQQCVEENNHLRKEIVKCDPTTPTDKRWLQAEVRALIALRASLEHKFRTPANSGHGSVWEEIALGMNGMGFDRTGRKCKEKWENINKYFKRAVTSDKKRSANAKTCQYFNDLELLYNSGLLNLGNAFSQTSNLGNGFSCTSNQNETKSETESQHCVLSKVDTSLLTCATIPRVVVSPAL